MSPAQPLVTRCSRLPEIKPAPTQWRRADLGGDVVADRSRAEGPIQVRRVPA
jgi:hypothetical protein